MIVTHVAPEGWVDTEEVGVIQPSHVAGMVHQVTLEDGDLIAGPQGPQGATGQQGPQGPRGVAPAGAVLFFAMASAPAGWLVCNGAAVSRSAYADLFAAIGILYGAGDGVTTFSLPDLRGEFVRGADGGRNVDTGRALGSAQGDSIKSHSHSITTTTFAGGGGGVPYGSGSASASGMTGDYGGGETRPRNVALLPCISTGG